MSASKPQTTIELVPIGVVRTEAATVPRHWSISDVEGQLIIHEDYLDGLQDIQAGQRILLLFYFDRSPEFSSEHLVQKPPHKDREYGVFSICSPKRPNPIGLSVLEVLEVQGNAIRVRGVDMLDGTPILDIKPYISADR